MKAGAYICVDLCVSVVVFFEPRMDTDKHGWVEQMLDLERGL